MGNKKDITIESRFAVADDIFTDEFKKINKELTKINNDHIKINHDEINKKRFPWFSRLGTSNSYYGTRYWEYPFSILSANLIRGMKCADIGCGTTPFTPYLCKVVGNKNVYGFDEYLIEDNSEKSHYNFGTRKKIVDEFGYHFNKSSITKIDAPDNYFDVVFCLSVLEHISDYQIKQKGLLEMVRILKPGGKLILTFDTSISDPLNDPLKIISCSGLIPSKNLDLRWPKHRFIKYESKSFDVFGLVLFKDSTNIFINHDEDEEIPLYKSYLKYLKSTTDYNFPFSELLMLRDIKSSMGPFKVFLKKILKRY